MDFLWNMQKYYVAGKRMLHLVRFHYFLTKPIPRVEDELIVRFSEVNDKLQAVVKNIAETLDKIESQYIELEI